MGIEIERKFLVRGDGWRAGVTGKAHLRQGYLSSGAKATVRVRLVDDARALLTLKGPLEGISRAEFEYDVPLADGRALLAMAAPNLVEKTRYRVPHAGLEWVVDVFEGAHAGLVLAEVELASPDESVTLPAWAGPEVTRDDRYANASLSRVPGVPGGGS